MYNHIELWRVWGGRRALRESRGSFDAGAGTEAGTDRVADQALR